ncbi:LytR family transcriptional regulator [Philodulcilactobacillus myokoensis]|uniref:LytR family transcriptional regulator n=1 Tax=Philodulcilactobacillus myokoensis TaxID=2929573 RepID=A0A9W6AZM5_9LACO|nr:LCP family protein [Philodulcilactobacillus myokoensis]GLB46352.1 LytR family transcriptional regulator [Philodulcilactobacillus myokoensis]
MPKKSHKIRNTILIVLAVIIVAIIGVGGYAMHNLHQASKNSYQPATAKNSRPDAVNQKHPISILLLGTDTGALGRDYKGRTDSMMLVTLNPSTKTTTMVSIPRDAVVNIPGDGVVKINSAYTYNGASSAMNVVSQWLNVPVDYFGLINMGGLKKAINEVGGIDIAPIQTFSYSGYHYKQGQMTHFDGDKALQYSRMRYQDPRGDYGRQERQRQLLTALIKKSVNIKSILNSGFLNSLSTQAQTNLNLGKLTDLAINYRDTNQHVNSTYLQGNGDMINGVSFQVVPQNEKQRITNLVRKNLDLKPAQTGTKYDYR